MIAALVGPIVLILLNVSAVSPRDNRGQGNIAIGPNPISGSWIIVVPAGTDKARLQLEWQQEKGASVHVLLMQLQGLSATQVHSSGAPVNFQLVREAGTFTFTGSFRRGTGTGEWTFKGNLAFVDELRKHGYEQTTEAELYALALSDVGTAYISELERAGYRKLTVSQLVSLYTNDVRADYIISLGSAGYSGLPPNVLVALRSNGITANETSVFKQLISGVITSGQLIALKSNGVTDGYIKSLLDAGYKQLTARQLIALRANGVTPDFIQRLQDRGYKNLTVERILSLRNKLPMEF